MREETRIIAVIPARYGSSRFPGKPLAKIQDKPMIQWVYEGANSAESISDVLVATDDERIKKVVNDFGGNAVMTSPDHKTGTDRILEALSGVVADYVLNIQGDERLVGGDIIDGLAAEWHAGAY
jgi:3-deoxy-manno-octulosonate cytidylyltransferase (CMP-KDO synthetase)